MKGTVQEILDKLCDIDRAIDSIERVLPQDYFPGQEPLCEAIDLLKEYKDRILNSRVDI